MKNAITPSPTTTSRLLALEGLRGIAAIIVVLFHSLIIFWPGMIYGMNPAMTTRHNMPYENAIYGSPFAGLFSGTFAVAIFFVLSGFVLTIGFFQTGDATIIRKLAAKRYIRLMLPALVSILVVWLIIALGFTGHKEVTASITGSNWLASLWQVVPNLGSALQQGLYGVFVTGDVTYNPVLWTMKYELIGSFIVFGVALLFRNSRYRWIVYTTLLLGLLNSWYMGFVIGLILADLYAHNAFPFKDNNTKILALLLPVGILWGGYPALTADNSFYQYMRLSFFSEAQNQSFYLLLGAAIVVTGVLAIPTLSRFFSHKRVSIIGKYTFSLYLIHMAVLFTVCTTLFVWLHGHMGYNRAAVLSMVITTPFVAVATYLFEKFVDAPSIRLSSKFANWFLGLPQKEKVNQEASEGWPELIRKLARLSNIKALSPRKYYAARKRQKEAAELSPEVVILEADK